MRICFVEVLLLMLIGYLFNKQQKERKDEKDLF